MKALYIIDLTFFGFYFFNGDFGYTRDPNLNVPHSFSEKELDDIKAIIDDSDNGIVLTALTESWSPIAINSVLKLLNISPNRELTVVIVDSLISVEDTNTINFNNVFRYNYCLMMSAEYEDQYGSNDIIDLNTDKFLYLMGKPYRPCRIEILYELYKSKKLSHCTWAFHYNDHIAEITRNQLPNLSDSEYEIFISDTQRKLDSIDMIFAPNLSHYSGYPIDLSLYSDTSFSLVSETLPTMLTEKTWRPIANKHAIVTTSHPDMIKELQDLGFDTFPYAIRHDQTLIAANDYELSIMTTENALYLIENINRYKAELTQSIKANYINYRRIAAEIRSTVPVNIEVLLKDRMYEKPSAVIMVPPDGIEPPTYGLLNRRSTI